ncbi:hypothetical protein ACHAWU_008021 [Discostella pseudostelligera]|uniref:Sulfotransferase domain-containing protein n=1 Tax=Discostella pseudostelligera TaxID=259834 RepID=A0ABD3MI46_9STRA
MSTGQLDVVKQRNGTTTFDPHRRRHQQCSTTSSATEYSRRRYYYLGLVCAIASLGITIPYFNAIAKNIATTHLYAYQGQQQQRNVTDEHPTEIAANTIATTNKVIHNKNDKSHDAHMHHIRSVENASKQVEVRDNSDNHLVVDDDNNNVTEEFIVTDDDNNEHDDEPHNYAILLTHYHKTGFVLSRLLMNLVVDLEYQSHGLVSPLQNAKTAIESRNIQKLRTMDHIDNNTGIQIAFGQRGNWIRNFVPARRHSAITGCPPFFTLDVGAIHLQEAPDLFCNDEELYRLLFGIGRYGDVSWNELLQHHLSSRRGGGNLSSTQHNRFGKGGDADTEPDDDASGRMGVKIVHLVRNPFQMALSNYLYHSQEPTPERWVHTDNPCEASYDSSENKSLASFVLPLLSSKTTITSEQLDAIVAMCHSLYQSNSTSTSSTTMSGEVNLISATFYEHLLKLNRFDGLRLATAQMVISSSAANGHLAGGDILRMGQNILQFENLLMLLSSSSTALIPSKMTKRRKFHLLTLSMDDYTGIKNTTIRFLDFVFGDHGVPRELRVKGAEDFESSSNRSKKGQHVTLGKHGDREELIQSLRDDSVLGPVLSEIEVLVEDALRKSV